MSFGRIVTAVASKCVVSFGCVREPTEATQRLPENDGPLGIQIVRAVVTRKPQMKQLREIQLTGLDNAANMAATTPGGHTYSGSMEIKTSYQPIAMKPLHSFVIVEFNISNITRKAELPARDLLLVDGKGSDHVTFGTADGSRENGWASFDSVTIDPGQPASLNWKWIFEVPENALKGSTVKCRGVSYPLNIK